MELPRPPWWEHDVNWVSRNTCPGYFFRWQHDNGFLLSDEVAAKFLLHLENRGSPERLLTGLCASFLETQSCCFSSLVTKPVFFLLAKATLSQRTHSNLGIGGARLLFHGGPLLHSFSTQCSNISSRNFLNKSYRRSFWKTSIYEMSESRWFCPKTARAKVDLLM